jgi:hypothetical protein
MSKRNLLKEAIADAKAVRETAIANAKLALEEAFTPKLQSMLSAKLQEDDELEMEEDEEFAGDIPDDSTEVGIDSADTEDSGSDEPAEETYEEGEEAPEGEIEEGEGEDEAPVEEDDDIDLDLEEIIKELEGEDEAPVAEDDDEYVTEMEHGEDEEPVAEDDDEIDLDEVIRSLSENDDEEVVEDDEESSVANDLEEAYATIKSLKDTLQEVNLLNAKLLFSNRLFKSNSLSENQKMKVIETFDRASNLREVKLVYTTLAESFTGGTRIKKSVTEGFASKKSNSTAPKGQIVESNGMANRMKRLAGLL